MANPIISRAELAVSTTPMTVKGGHPKNLFSVRFDDLIGCWILWLLPS